MVNVPPPLLCSTPPPIDFGEEDDDSGLQSTLQLEDADEYSEYGLVTDTHETVLNVKAPSLPELPISSSDYSAPSLPPDLSNGHSKTAAAERQTVEAFNYQVKTPAFAQKRESLPTVQQEDIQVDVVQQPMNEVNEELETETEEEELNTNDNVPSLKLDSLSLYSSESVSPTCTLSLTTDEPVTKAAVLCHQVTLEDVTDDSDEECSPKKPKELFIPEGADDFFAIEIVATPTLEAPSAIRNQISEAEQDFAEFQETPPDDLPKQELNGNSPIENENKKQNSVEDDDDFGDFADFSAAPAVVAIQQPKQADSNDDGLDDFKDFETAKTTTVISAQSNDDVVHDDDDFGDFSEPIFATFNAPAAATKAPVLPQPPPPAAINVSITERVKPVLELMFASQQTSEMPHTSKYLPLPEVQSLQFGAIEQAHALDYQWASSEMRHALVRSLGIDSRNILFGDKWNASMPRFAANLSFDPLKPLKPLTATPTAACSVLEPQTAANSNWQSSSSTQQTLQGLETIGNATQQTSQSKTQPGIAYGQDAHANSAGNSADETAAGYTESMPATSFDDATTAASVFTAAAATATISTALSANGNGHSFDDSEQLSQQPQQQQQQLDLRRSPTLPSAVNSNQPMHEVTSSNSFALPLKETHIYTPSKSDTAVAKTTTLSPIDFDYEIASAGIIIDETVVKKEYRDVEYKPPPYALDSPSKLSASGKTTQEEDDFSDFQSVPAIKSAAMLQPPRNGTPTFGEQMILSPAILLPKSVPLAKTSIEWGDNSLANINADELARIEELFSNQFKPPTISASVAQQSPKQQSQQQEDDEWSEFVSVPVQQQQQQQQQQQKQQQHKQQKQQLQKQHLQLKQHQVNNHNNNVNVLKARNAATSDPSPAATPPTVAAGKEDDWSDFVSSTPLSAALNSRAMPQFNSGAWQSANFYNNPLSLYQQQQQPHAHSNLVPNYQGHSTNNNHNNNNNCNNNNNVSAMPQQIHMMHDFSTAPIATAGPTTYQQQHHQHHQQQLQQQQQHRQQFHLGNAKVAPRISLIPDLSFVAPALPTNAGAFMSSLPKPTFSAKK